MYLAYLFYYSLRWPERLSSWFRVDCSLRCLGSASWLLARSYRRCQRRMMSSMPPLVVTITMHSWTPEAIFETRYHNRGHARRRGIWSMCNSCSRTRIYTQFKPFCAGDSSLGMSYPRLWPSSRSSWDKKGGGRIVSPISQAVTDDPVSWEESRLKPD